MECRVQIWVVGDQTLLNYKLKAEKLSHILGHAYAHSTKEGQSLTRDREGSLRKVGTTNKQKPRHLVGFSGRKCSMQKR